MTGWRGRIFGPEPLARVALLRVAVYVFTVCDLFWVVNDVIPHAATPTALYRPVRMRLLLHLPDPSVPYTQALRVVIIVGCALLVASALLPSRPDGAGPGRARPDPIPQLLTGLVVAAAMTDWVSIGMSYGKIDHDHFALIVALWVLASVGPARVWDLERSEAAGWALTCVQVAAVAVYFLSAWAKIRFGGWDWVTGYTFAWAMTRRGTGLGRAMLHWPWTLQLGQWSLFLLELSTPLMVVLRGRVRYAFVAVLLAFHLTTYLTLRIHFLPLVVCLLAFLPLERLVPATRTRTTVETPESAPSR